MNKRMAAIVVMMAMVMALFSACGATVDTDVAANTNTVGIGMQDDVPATVNDFLAEEVTIIIHDFFEGAALRSDALELLQSNGESRRASKTILENIVEKGKMWIDPETGIKFISYSSPPIRADRDIYYLSAQDVRLILGRELDDDEDRFVCVGKINTGVGELSIYKK